MNNFDRVLRILQESSIISENFSKYIFNMIFNENKTLEIEDAIEQYFPLDDSNRQKFVNISQIIFNITKIPLENFSTLVKESQFPSSQDMLLSILNKYFTSNQRATMRTYLINYCNNRPYIKTDAQIIHSYSNFNSKFGIKPDSDLV
jgi:hypothetical protein